MHMHVLQHVLRRASGFYSQGKACNMGAVLAASECMHACVHMHMHVLRHVLRHTSGSYS